MKDHLRRKLDMKITKKKTLSFLFVFWIVCSFAQSDLQLVNIGDLITTNGDVINDCEVGYRTVGKLNSDRSNVVLWPTWFTGTSEDITNPRSLLYNTIDTTGLYIIVVDALTNGVSSSPSNTRDFPMVTVRDMVNSQHLLLVNHLKIDHLFAIIGASLGGMQIFEWLVAYPDFMDKAIPINGTPKQTFFDIFVWQTQADLIIEAGTNEEKLDFSMKRVYDIFFMNLFTPSFFVRTENPENLSAFRKEKYALMLNSKDYLGGLKAMIQQDIYKESKNYPDSIKSIVKAEVLVIISQQDHLVNPTNSIAFSKVLNCRLLELKGDCGHSAPWYEYKKIKEATSLFLKEKDSKL